MEDKRSFRYCKMNCLSGLAFCEIILSKLPHLAFPRRNTLPKLSLCMLMRWCPTTAQEIWWIRSHGHGLHCSRSFPATIDAFPKEKVLIMIWLLYWMQPCTGQIIPSDVHILLSNSFRPSVQYSSPCRWDFCEADDERWWCGSPIFVA